MISWHLRLGPGDTRISPPRIIWGTTASILKTLEWLFCRGPRSARLCHKLSLYWCVCWKGPGVSVCVWREGYHVHPFGEGWRGLWACSNGCLLVSGWSRVSPSLWSGLHSTSHSVCPFGSFSSFHPLLESFLSLSTFFPIRLLPLPL